MDLWSYNSARMTTTRKKIGVIFGGRSGEHEVSLVSATSVIKEMPKDKFDIKEIGISKNGNWYVGENLIEEFKKATSERDLESKKVSAEDAVSGCDVVFPVLHGSFGEDGTIQGLFEMLKVPYVGCGVLASSACMDKIICKSILHDAGINVVPFVHFTRSSWFKNNQSILDKIRDEIGFPCFVKPSNMGSSVGISKATAETITSAINLAAEFDSRILIEKAVDAREIECAVLGNENPSAAPLGEIIVGGEFYDYYDKYVDGKSRSVVPIPDLDESKQKEISDICIRAFKAMDCSGLSRVDCFVDRNTGEVFLNEINTLPGFTSISMYPKMWLAAGLSFSNLIEKLIDLAVERFEEKRKNKISFDSGSNWFQTP